MQAQPDNMASSADEAKARGLTRYNTGEPCKHGHYDDRMAINKRCVGCMKAYKSEYQKTEAYKEKHREYQRNRARQPYRRNQIKEYQKRPDVKERRRQYYRDYREQNRDRINHRLSEYKKSRMANDPQFRISVTLRRRLGMAISKGAKSGSSVELLGASIEEVRKHIESQFQDGMSWDNHGEWHIDHIKPLASFDLQDPEQLAEACHYTNLQPLWAEDNIRKGAA